MFFFVLTIVTLIVMLATTIILDKNHELRLGRAIVIAVVSLMPLANALAAFVCIAHVAIEVLSLNNGIVIYRWKK